MASIKHLAKVILQKAIICYQWLLSPLLGRNCRFYPSCSQYAIEAIEKHGAISGTGLAVKRLLKCHPWHEGGVDQIP